MTFILAQQLVTPSADLTPIWAIVVVIILREVFAFLIPLLKGDRRAEFATAIEAIADNLVELRKMHEADRSVMLGLQYSQAAIKTDTEAIRKTGHEGIQQTQVVIGHLMGARDDLRELKSRG